MGNNMKLSVIICTFNVEKYVRECINSVLSQKYNSMEIICIDDCSTDQTGQILEEYSNSPQIKIIHNMYNRSSSYCRKLGIQLAQGEYIMFLDGDDEYAPDICSYLVSKMDQQRVDMIHFGTEVIPELGVSPSAVAWFEKFSSPYLGKLENSSVFEGCFSKKLYRFNIWNKIYRADVCKLASTYIDDGYHPKAQDLLLFFIISFLSKSYMGIAKKGYKYHYGRGITGRKSNDLVAFSKICTQSEIADLCKKFLSKCNSLSKYYLDYLKMELDLYLECESHYKNLIPTCGLELDNILIESWKNHAVYPRAYLTTNRCYEQPYECLKEEMYLGEIPVFFSVNENYVQYLSVTLSSLIINKRCRNKYHIYVLHEYLSDDSKNYFDSIQSDDFQITLINVSNFMKNYKLYSRGHIGVEMYYRLFIADIIKDTQIKKAIYLDSDLVVNADLLDLYLIDLSDNILAGAYNASLIHSTERIIKKLKVDPNKYINSGVLLINLEQYRKHDVKDLCLQLLSGNTTFVNPDQDALNIVCKNRIQMLPLEWNYIWLYVELLYSEKEDSFKKYCEYYVEHCKNPKIIHYAGKNKPWNTPANKVCKSLHDIYWMYAKSSPYYRMLSKQLSKEIKQKNHSGWYVPDVDYYTYCSSINKLRISSELCLWYKNKMGKKLNLNHPKSFNEKIQWLKMYDSTELKTKLADKYLARFWISERIGGEYLVPLIGVWDTFEEIDFTLLPNQFALKTNHGSGWNYIVTDKSHMHLEKMRLDFERWMQKDYAFLSGFELHYHSISRKIIAEEYIGDTSGLIDYRFYCFNGEPKQVWVDIFSGTANHVREIFDTNWNKIKLRCTWPSANGKLDKKPELFEKMMELSRKLSSDFYFVRVDFFEVNHKLYVGELTFTPMSGSGKFEPAEYDIILGNMLNIPKTTIKYRILNRTIYPIHCAIKYFETKKEVKKLNNQQQLRQQVEQWIKDSKNFEFALTTLQLLSLSNDSWAQRQLAMIYLKGINVKQNRKLAIDYFRKSAALGNEIAKRQLIDALLPSEDYEILSEVFALRFDLANNGDAGAQRRLAMMYLKGKGTDSNKEQAIYWARLAFQKTNASEDRKILIECLNDTDVPELQIELFNLRLQLAEEGHVYTQRKLAKMYEMGIGVDQSDAFAQYWYAVAENNGDIESVPRP